MASRIRSGGRTVFAWGRIPAGRPGPGDSSPRRSRAFGRYPRAEQLSFFPGHADEAPHEAPRGLRELRLPAGGPPPFRGPWTLAAVVGEALSPPSPA